MLGTLDWGGVFLLSLVFIYIFFLPPFFVMYLLRVRLASHAHHATTVTRLDCPILSSKNYTEGIELKLLMQRDQAESGRMNHCFIKLAIRDS